MTHVAHQEVTCPHCGRVGQLLAMRRHHFDNCRVDLERGLSLFDHLDLEVATIEVAPQNVEEVIVTLEVIVPHHEPLPSLPHTKRHLADYRPGPVTVFTFGAPRVPEQVYLNVPYAERKEAQALGAKWDWHRRSWYVPNTVDFTKLSRWSR